MKFIKLLILLTLISSPLSAQSSRMIIDSGHNQAVGSIEYHEATGSLVSADETGLIKIWDLSANRLKYQIDTGLRGSLNIKVHPVKTEIAVLVSRPGYTGIEVWNWITGRRLFTKNLTGRPVQFEYSAMGKYLFITRVGTPSIVLFNSQTGVASSYLKRLSSFFSYAYIGSKETTIMTYSNTGMIRYYDIRTSSLKSESSTKEDLLDLTVLQTESKRYLIGRKGNILYMIDRLNGDVRDTLSIQNYSSFSIDQNNGVVSILTKTDTGRLKLSTSSTTGARFTPLSAYTYLNPQNQSSDQLESDFFRISSNHRAMLSMNRQIYISDNNGTIWTMNPHTLKPEVFKKNTLSALHDLSFNDNKLYLLGEDRFLTMESRFFSATSNSMNYLNDLSIENVSNPLAGQSYLVPYNATELLIWSGENDGKGYVLYNPETQSVLNRNNNYNSSLKEVYIRNNQVLALESTGEASLSNIHTGIKEFSFSALGMESLNFIDDSSLMAGKSLMKSSRNPLMTIQATTGEITPFNDDRFLVYSIVSPEGGNKIYTIGLMQKSSGDIETQIRSHSKSNPAQTSTLYNMSGEFVNALLTADTSSYVPTLYGSISGRDIFRIRSNQKKVWDYDKNIKNMYYYKSILYILNSDGSLTLFDPGKGKVILDYYLMEDGNWIALSSSDDIPFVSDRSMAEMINSYSSRGSSVRTRYKLIDIKKED